MPNKHIYKSIFGVLLLVLLGCQPQNAPKPTEQINIDTAQPSKVAPSEPSVFVVYSTNRQAVGNAAFYTGTLNAKNGCLYINDLLIVITGLYIDWQNEPFWIGNHRGEKFTLGDEVSVGGSQSKNYDEYLTNGVINTPNCKAEKVWHAVNIDKPFL
ncbi:hypothetical protein LU290_09390 [Moraxella nasibovis]|uniref:hypothetical protein n=1 Tax=Moraxella nasibovis TaxID=2904120 RepID=UPI002410AF4B|nr:hypothetical protein [Moraxella nasibovis]WFF38448.1 hypothetical protein LU290_09390 [Moraxella nasibovis]